MNIGELYTLNHFKIKDKPAVIFENQTLTHEEFEHRTNQLANALFRLGYRKGDRLAVLSKNHMEYPVIIYGAAKAGVVFTPLNYRMTGKELASILNHCSAQVLIVSREFVHTIQSIRDQLSVQHYMVIDREQRDGYLNYYELVERQSPIPPDVVIDEEDIYYIGYTSGTTGKPKGAIATHGSRIMSTMILGIEFQISTNDIQLVAGPIYHSAPHHFMLSQLLLGGTIVIMGEYDPEEVLKNIDAYKITNMFMAPTMYNMILQLPEEVRRKYDLSSIRTLVSAGAPLPTRVKEGIIQLFPCGGLYEFYGSTETGLNTVLKPADQMRMTRSVGKPMLFNDVKILDENGNLVQPGEVGEIYTKNPYRFKGYLNDEEETRKAFRGDYLSVGDLARMDENGFIYIVDRKKDMVISGGVNIYPTEIEEVLYQHPAVKEAAVIGIPDEKWGESLQAFVVKREEVTEEELIDFCKQHLASYKKPKGIVFLDELPRNPSGKILKTVLRQPYWENSEFKV